MNIESIFYVIFGISGGVGALQLYIKIQRTDMANLFSIIEILIANEKDSNVLVI